MAGQTRDNPDLADAMSVLMLAGILGGGLYVGIKLGLIPWGNNGNGTPPPDPSCLEQYSYRLCQILQVLPRYFEYESWWKMTASPENKCSWLAFRTYLSIINERDPGDPAPPEFYANCA